MSSYTGKRMQSFKEETGGNSHPIIRKQSTSHNSISPQRDNNEKDRNWTTTFPAFWCTI